MTVAIGLALAANAPLVAFALSVGKQLFVDHLAGTVFAPASTVFFDQLLSYLVRGVRVFLWLGVLLVVVGWFASRTRSGRAVRGAVSGGLERAGSAVSFPAMARVGGWVASNAGWLRVVSGVAGAVVLLWGNNASPERLAWSVLLVLVLLAVIQVLVGTAERPRSRSLATA